MTIVAVAIRVRGTTYALPAPNRHHHVIGDIIRQTGVSHVDVPEDDEGFLDERGTYYRRGQALQHALMHDQVKDPSKVRLNRLFSEDVW